jgi:hypothetical protein
LFDENINAFEELFSAKDEEEGVHFLFLLHHVFRLDNEPLFEFRGVLLEGFWESVGNSFVMDAGYGIIFTLGVAKLKVVKLIETPEDVKDNNTIS